MTTYKPGEEWKKTLNENTFLKMRVTELQDENETLRIEIIEMRNAADQTDEVLDEYFGDEEILDEAYDVNVCKYCSEDLVWSYLAIARVHKGTGNVTCPKTPSTGHDPTGNEY